MLKGIFIQSQPLEKLSTNEVESTTRHPSQGPTLEKLVMANELHAKELSQRNGTSTASNYQEEQLLTVFIIQRTPLDQLSI